MTAATCLCYPGTLWRSPQVLAARQPSSVATLPFHIQFLLLITTTFNILEQVL